MASRGKWLLVGTIVGALLAIVLVIGGTHGSSGESSTERRSEQFFFYIPLFDERGPPEQVKTIERWWQVRLFTVGTITGGVLGLLAAYGLTGRKRPIKSTT